MSFLHMGGIVENTTQSLSFTGPDCLTSPGALLTSPYTHRKSD